MAWMRTSVMSWLGSLKWDATGHGCLVEGSHEEVPRIVDLWKLNRWRRVVVVLPIYWKGHLEQVREYTTLIKNSLH